MTPYMTFVIEPLAALLGLFGAGTMDDQPLWTACMKNLSKSLSVDEGSKCIRESFARVTVSHMQLQHSGMMIEFERSMLQWFSRFQSALVSRLKTGRRF